MSGASAFIPKNMAAEFLGTFILVFAVGCHTLNGAVNTAFTGLSVGSTLMVLVYALGPVSGAHLNPAVTFATALTGKKAWGESLVYMVIQLAGGFIHTRCATGCTKRKARLCVDWYVKNQHDLRALSLTARIAPQQPFLHRCWFGFSSA